MRRVALVGLVLEALSLLVVDTGTAAGAALREANAPLAASDSGKPCPGARDDDKPSSEVWTASRLEGLGVEHLCTESYRDTEFRKAWGSPTKFPPLLDKEIQCDEIGMFKCHSEDVVQLTESLTSRGQKDFFQTIPCDVYRAIQGQTLWLVGDSQTQYWYKSLRCFMREFWADAKTFDDDISSNKTLLDTIWSDVLQHPDIPPEFAATVMPLCTTLVGGTRICHVRLNTMRQFTEVFLPRLSLFGVKAEELMVVNFGLWQHRGYGSDVYGCCFEEQLEAFGKYYQSHSSELPRMLWRDVSPQHFEIKHGEFPTPGTENFPWPFMCKPLDVSVEASGELSGGDGHTVKGGWRNPIATPLMASAGLPIIHTWNETAGLHNMHVEQYVKQEDQQVTYMDCSHYCSPGAYSIYTWQFLRTVRQLPCQPQGATADLSQSSQSTRPGNHSTVAEAETPRPRARVVPRRYMRGLNGLGSRRRRRVVAVQPIILYRG